jgi:hypothetical protein
MRGIIIVAAMLATTPACAGNDSVYTDFNLKTCIRVTPETTGDEGESSGTFECKGYGKYVATFAEGDLRSFVSFGTESADHCSFHQTFSGFNSVGNRIEWRRKDGKAIATILRWTVSYDPADSSKTKTWLVVTKLEPENSCHMAYVEGSYPNANGKARQLADTMSASFKCKGGVIKVVAKSPIDPNSLASGGCQ